MPVRGSYPSRGPHGGQSGVSAENRPAGLAGGLVRAGGDQPEDHGEERAESEHHANDQENEDLRVGAKERPHGMNRTLLVWGAGWVIVRYVARSPTPRVSRVVIQRASRAAVGCTAWSLLHYPFTCRLATQRKTGGDLLSQALASQVPSALRGLTALFGMGRGVSPSP